MASEIRGISWRAIARRVLLLVLALCFVLQVCLGIECIIKYKTSSSLTVFIQVKDQVEKFLSGRTSMAVETTDPGELEPMKIVQCLLPQYSKSFLVGAYVYSRDDS